MSPSAFAVELCRIGALAENAHTQCLPAWIGRDICRQIALVENKSPWCHLQTPDFEVPDFKAVPIAFYPFGEAFNVIGVDASNLNLLGARLVAVENRPVESIRATLRPFAGGTRGHRDQRAADVLASPEQLHAVGLSRSNDSVRYEFVARGGRKIRRRFSVRRQSAKLIAWRELPAADQAPWAFQEPSKRFRHRDAPEIDSIVVPLRQNLDGHNLDAGSEKLADFLQTAEERREALGRQNVVLDMRFNGGGNLISLAIS
jgi:hypothetical protein